jgi:hypothetical protein
VFLTLWLPLLVAPMLFLLVGSAVAGHAGRTLSRPSGEGIAPPGAALCATPGPKQGWVLTPGPATEQARVRAL